MTYSTRANAVRAAKAACRKALGAWYEAAEGPDFLIHPRPPTTDEILAGRFRDRFSFELVGPAKEAA